MSPSCSWRAPCSWGPSARSGLPATARAKPAVAGALPYLERAALTPHLRDLARHHDVALKSLRESAAAATNEKLPELAPMHRVRARDFLFTGLIALAAYLLITKLAKIGFGTIADELRHSDLVWVARRAAPRPG